MGSSKSSIVVLTLLSFFVFSVTCATSSTLEDNFIQCLSLQQPSIPIPIYTQSNPSFTSIFLSSARNLRFVSAATPKPLLIILPSDESHIQAAIVCCRKQGLDLKVRSGGHDVEGLSYVSDAPFIIADLVNFRSININLQDNTAWVQAGANLGEVYYRISEKSKTLGFPAGFCPAVGVGGHFSGGGFGALVRKYGLAADQVIDARLVNVDGKILDRQSMGEDLFWAIRGGGASSFAVVLSWKINLVPVPPIVTVATVDRTLQQGATRLVLKWQFIADKLDEDLYIGVTPTVVNIPTQGGQQRTVVASFSILFLGRVDELLQLMQVSFPELGLTRNDTAEMSWVESHVYFYARGRPVEEVLLDRDDSQTKIFLKVKTDYVKIPISEIALEGIWRKFMEEEMATMLWTPFGGRMNEISEFALPYPHRIGNIFNILYVAGWQDESQSVQKIDWLRTFYDYMTPYVSKFPRTAYLNYKDLDLGTNIDGVFSYLNARTWGVKYFKSNFERLVYVKTKVDPSNFFKNKQSIPPFIRFGN
ncbi:FAD linked oxidase [Macleaya cordata]|uniref:FAD linked oxidase n=1 Tax=Macleaya cordata TaxID=56857 RepID=A0A200PPY4_MACCD|nr:FAD linked oxidase [Macleaya cordata]